MLVNFCLFSRFQYEAFEACLIGRKGMMPSFLPPSTHTYITTGIGRMSSWQHSCSRKWSSGFFTKNAVSPKLHCISPVTFAENLKGLNQIYNLLLRHLVIIFKCYKNLTVKMKISKLSFSFFVAQVQKSLFYIFHVKWLWKFS